MKTIDLRSDTKTRPSEEMRAWCAQRAGVAPPLTVQAGSVTPE